jgi:adenine-specific DNA methylase
MTNKKKLIEVALPLEAQWLGLESYASDLFPW